MTVHHIPGEEQYSHAIRNVADKAVLRVVLTWTTRVPPDTENMMPGYVTCSESVNASTDPGVLLCRARPSPGACCFLLKPPLYRKVLVNMNLQK